jgi:DNA-binding GntR family transcriptional regulator
VTASRLFEDGEPTNMAKKVSERHGIGDAKPGKHLPPEPRNERTTAFVYETIKRQIIDKKLPPGEKINQQRIATQLGVSRTPVVKALHKLESQGLVDNIHDKGFYVHRLSIKELLDLFSLREALDTMIVSELVESITDRQIESLEAVFEDFWERDPADINELQYWGCDQKFHNQMMDYCHNTLAKRIDDNFQIFSRTFSVGLLRKPAETLLEHKQIIEGIRMRNRDMAVEAVYQHVSKTKGFLQEVVRKLRKLGVDPSGIPFNEFSRGKE